MAIGCQNAMPNCGGFRKSSIDIGLVPLFTQFDNLVMRNTSRAISITLMRSLCSPS